MLKISGLTISLPLLQSNLMNIVITGTAGLLGSHLSRHLLKRGHKVFGVDDFSGGYEDFLPEDNNFVFHKRCLGQDSIFDIFEEEQID